MDSLRHTSTLSGRMRAVADLVDVGARVADVGTDHGYIPIDLILSGTASHVIALDVKEGPLERARRHVKESGLEDRIEVRFSDGLKNVSAGEADTVILSGMGGPLMEKILTEGKDVVDQLQCLILQPQSEVAEVRRFLARRGFLIRQEDMVEEGRKFYFLMKAVPGEPEAYEAYEYRYGKRLLEEKHPVLKDYLLWERQTLAQIDDQLKEEPAPARVRERRAQLNEQAALNKRALKRYEEK